MKIVVESTLNEINKKRQQNKPNDPFSGQGVKPQEITKEGLEEYKKGLRQKLFIMFNLDNNDTVIININEG